MYPPSYHLDSDFNKALDVIRHFPLATLISYADEKVMVSHLPVIFKPLENGLGKICGHLDSNNPQCAHLNNKKSYLIFNGPDSYISPTVYTTTQLPTWNYIRVHIEGQARLLEEPADIINILMEMSAHYEKPDSSFSLTPDHEHMNRLVHYIKGFEIIIERWEGKFKLSQDKNNEDQMAAKQALLNNTPPPTASIIEGLI